MSKESHNAHIKAWRKRNPDKVRAYSRAWCLRNPEKRREIDRKYYQENSQKRIDRIKRYRELNPDRDRITRKVYCERHPDRVRNTNKAWRVRNPEKRRAYTKAYALMHPDLPEKQRLRRWRNRTECIQEYGGRCACCGESELLFLTIDHVNGGGTKHRETIGSNIYSWLRRNNYPKEGYQVLCMNCNWGRSQNGGTCPHMQKTEEGKAS